MVAVAPEPEPTFDVEVAHPLELDAFAAVGRPDTPDAPDPARLEPDPDRIPRRPERARASDDVPSPSHDPSAAHPRDQTDDFARQPTPAAASEAVVTVLDPPAPKCVVVLAEASSSPSPSPNPFPAASSDRPVSTTHKYKHRASIGHDARVMEERGLRVQNGVGRPQVKSIFQAMAGVRRFGEDGGAMHPKLVAVDIDAYGEDWTPREQRMVAFYFLLHALAWLGLTFADPDSWLRKSMRVKEDLARFASTDEDVDANLRTESSSSLDTHFWTKLVFQQLAIWLVFSLCGLAVVTKGWKEGYSRKVCHVVMYLMPFLMHLAWPSDRANGMPTVWTMSWTVWFQFVPFYLQIKPARRRSTFLMLVFRAYDRAQDRPHTLSWLLTQLGGGYLVILALYLYLQSRGAEIVPPGAERAVLIPVIVNVFGDGLAEPVGIAFGRHEYRARALFYDGKCCAGEFKRTLEGSFVVYLFTVLAVLPCGGGVARGLRIFTDAQYAVALALLPPIMTVTEAFAPHTWDNPFITLVGSGFLLGLYELVP